jgi:LPPG:FO 2-phospho-L-lactate transferase
MTDDPVETRMVVQGEGEIGFQDYFVRRRHAVPVTEIRFAGAGGSRPAPGVLEAIDQADALVICPSNPLVSIAPILAVPGIRAAVAARREQTVAVSPLVAGAALKGPADRLLAELGHEVSVVGIARLYAGLAATLVVDEADAPLAPAVEAAGVRCVAVPAVMRSVGDAAALASAVLDAAGVGRRP